jgi:hypothetical protein
MLRFAIKALEAPPYGGKDLNLPESTNKNLI